MQVSTQSSSVFHAVADPTRRAILDQLRHGPRPVNDIAGLFSVSRPAISKHLRVLRRAGLVRKEPKGRQRIYRLEAKPLGQLDRWLEQYRLFWTANLMGLKAYVEKKEESR